ncbi:hypothetical protein Nham_3911 [Nitrobacter hamburgensis X14]|uniref:Uncharacterized protein n=1 Tax=Nitrobacter hamburgensis (strain DSM 10229 / NCIMB 13809 / X14) TaxID=323097 RepID=Q1QGP7_NITHX|nr:hypothetical protein Nham_3911 [Nitrobacter hamburgensis X14]
MFDGFLRSQQCAHHAGRENHIHAMLRTAAFLLAACCHSVSTWSSGGIASTYSAASFKVRNLRQFGNLIGGSKRRDQFTLATTHWP